MSSLDWLWFVVCLLVIYVLLAESAGAEPTRFERDQCGYFRAAVIDNMIAAGRGDQEAQKAIALFEAGCTPEHYTCIDDLMPGHAMRCEVNDHG